MSTEGGGSHTMESLIADINTFFRMRDYGGRIRRIEGHEVLVLDVPMWSESLAQTLRERHPTLNTSVETCSESLSGFAVRLRLDPSRDAWRRVFTAVTVAAVALAVTAYCLDV